MPRILIVDDDKFFRKVITKLLDGRGYKITAAESGEEALRILQAHAFDLMISDVNMAPMNGLKLLRNANESYPDMGVIMLTGHDEISVALEAMKSGAFDFLVKPFQLHDLFLTVQRSLEYYNASPNSKPLKTRLDLLEGLVAENAGMSNVCDIIRRIAPTTVTVLLHGEDGSEKELIARSLHYYSPRKDEPFIAADCATLPAHLIESELFGCVKSASDQASAATKGLFEKARGGTLFLNNIAALPIEIQAKLLNVIQDEKIYKVGGSDHVWIDVRTVVASSENLKLLVKQGAFCENLYCRLSALRVNIPPVRDRPEDLFPLIAQALQRNLDPGAEVPVLDRETKEILYNYTWPGNVRELEDVILHARSSVKNGVITKNMLPATIVTDVEEGLQSGAITSHNEQLKGSSFKSLLLRKNEENMKRAAERSKQPTSPPKKTLQHPDNDEETCYW